MKKFFCLIIMILFAFPLVACSGGDENDLGEITKMKLSINNENFEVQLEVSDTTKEICKHLPLDVAMSDLNGNEKYFYMDLHLPTNKTTPLRIEVGDVMLYQDNCLVIFYESFDSPFYYTRIGKIKNTEKLKETVGKGNVSVIWSL